MSSPETAQRPNPDNTVLKFLRERTQALLTCGGIVLAFGTGIKFNAFMDEGRGESLDEREKKVDEREKKVDEREKKVDERELNLDDRKMMADERRGLLDEREILLMAKDVNLGIKMKLTEEINTLRETEREVEREKSLEECNPLKIDPYKNSPLSPFAEPDPFSYNNQPSGI